MKQVPRMCLLALLLVIPMVIADDKKCTTGFSVVAPEAAVAGKSTAVLVTLHSWMGDIRRPINVTLRLERQDDRDSNESTLVASTWKTIYGHGIIPLKVPSNSVPASHTLRAQLTCPRHVAACGLPCGPPGCAPAACPAPECGAAALYSHSALRVAGPVRDVLVRPDRELYHPGDEVTIWVLALDHDLKLPKNILGTVSLKDPAGTKVAIWDQVPLDEGVKKFTITLSSHAAAGAWTAAVECAGGAWAGALNVSGGGAARAAGGASSGAASGAAEEHYVELRFGAGTRRRYKPGLPFVGKVVAMSTEKSVRVRVRVYDNTTSIYSQDIEISKGEGSFNVPAVLADSDVIHLQAELVSVEGKEIESHYILAREPILKWNSSSDCYILIEGMDKPLQVGGHAHATIASTCPCERDVHLAVLTDGRAAAWAERRAVAAAGASIEWGGPARAASGAALCRFNYSFPVKSDMAPASQLLVYYVTPEGETVSDVAEFQVQLLHKEVSVTLETKTPAVPGADFMVRINAPLGSLVCLVGGNAPVDKFDPWANHKQSHAGSTDSQDFLQAGVSLFQRRCAPGAARSSVTYRREGLDPRRPDRPPLLPRPRDALWLWDCFNHTLDTSRRLVIVPLSLTDGAQDAWLWAASVGPAGLRAALPVPLTPPAPGLVARLPPPPPLRQGEALELDVGMANQLDGCMDVCAILSLSGGAQFASNGMLFVTERLRLGPRGATSLVVRILATKPGLYNLTADISGFTSDECEAAGSPAASRPAGRVLRVVPLAVHAEGLSRTDTESAYFCANEHTLISTKEKYKYEWMSAPRNRAALVFEVRAGQPVTVALAEERTPSSGMYHVTIGDADNALTWIGRGEHGYGVHLASAETPDALSEGDFRTFWVSWEHGTLAAGRGALPSAGALTAWRLDSGHKVRHVGFSTAWGKQAEFRVWNFNDEAGFSQVVQLSLPRWAVPGSAAGELLVAGGLALPILDTPPSGASSGLAAAAAALAPLLVLAKENATKHGQIIADLPGQVQSLLSFRKTDNSFSDHRGMSSHLATVHVLEVLAKTQSYFGIDPELLQSIKRWVQLRQEEDGSFTPLPADIKIPLLTIEAESEVMSPKKGQVNAYEELDYGIVEKWKNLSKEVLQLERNVEVTAETLATLMEIGMENDLDSDTIIRSKTYLEKNLFNVTSSHPLASMVYALVLSQSTLVPEALERLRNASTTEEGDFGWPHPLPRRDVDWLYEEDSTRRVNPPLLTSLEDFKASLCTLLVHTSLGDLRSAEPVARYLFYRSHLLDRHTELLYQAVKAFSAFSTLAYDRHRSLTVSLATAGMELTDTVELRAHHPARHLHLPSLPTKVFVYATGAGCATVQGRITYSTYTPSSDNALLTIWSAVIEEIRPERSSLEELQGKLPTLNMKTCFKWKSQERSGVLRLEVSLFSGYELMSVSPVVVDGGTFADLQHGSKDNFVWFIFANISSSCPVCINYQVKSAFVLSSLRPAFASIYPATRPDLAAEIFFHTKIGSPLLKGIIEDDIITWFGKTENGVPNVGRDIPHFCECGKICRSDNQATLTTESSEINNARTETQKEFTSLVVDKTTEIPVKVEDNSSLEATKALLDLNNNTNTSNDTKDTPIIVPSVFIDANNNDTSDIVLKNSLLPGDNHDEIVIQQNVVTIRKSNPTKPQFDPTKKQQYQKKQPMPRKKGTLKHTYGENHEMLKKNVKVLQEQQTVLPPTTKESIESSSTPAESISSTTETISKKSSSSQEKPSETVTTASISVATDKQLENVVTIPTMMPPVASTVESSSKPIAEPTTVLNTVTVSHDKDLKTSILTDVMTTSNPELLKTQIVTEHVSKPLSGSAKPSTVTPYPSPQVPISVNREKHHPPAQPISETTLRVNSETQSRFLPGKKDQYLIVDRNALWGMLKEVVQIEMDKNQERLDAESNKVDKKEEREKQI